MTDGARETRPWEARDEQRLLLRLLTDEGSDGGELTPAEARELRRRLDEEPELATRFERLAAPWRSLEPPPVTLPPGFAGRVMARLREARGNPPSLLTAPVRVRSLATLALAVGLAAGPLLVASVSGDPGTLAPVEIAETLGADWLDDSPNLAQSYLQALETGTDGDVGTDTGQLDNGSPEGPTSASPEAGETP